MGKISVRGRFCGFTQIFETLSGKSLMLNDGRLESKIKIDTWVGRGFFRNEVQMLTGDVFF
jgi:hypothetical protein